MNCEFCGNIIPNDEVSCPHCGSLVRNVMSEKSSTVISVSQQNDIGNYKMKSEYKLSQQNENDDDASMGTDISRQAFSAQKFSSPEQSRAFYSDRDFVIRADTPPANNRELSQSQEVSADENPNYYQTAFTPSSKTYTLSSSKKQIPKTSKQIIPPGKVSLKKAARNKVKLKKEQTSADNPYSFQDDNPYENYQEKAHHNFINEEGYVELHPGITKNEFLKLHYVHGVRMSFFISVIMIYCSLLGIMIAAAFSQNLFALFMLLAFLGLTYAYQFRFNTACSWAILILGTVFSLCDFFRYGSIAGFPLIISGIFAVSTSKKFNALWDEYQTYGRIPFTGQSINRL